MSKITFYRQKRRDGGLHTGLLLDGSNAWEHFEPGADDMDPVLLWFVDIRAEGRSLPRHPEKAREWLLEQAPAINKGLQKLAADLQAGMDFNSLPLQQELTEAPEGIRLKIVCSVMRRFDSLNVAKLLTQFAKRWRRDLRQLRGSEHAHVEPA